MPGNIGYSYSSHVLTQWSILLDQYNRQRYYELHCCFDFDRTTYEMQPDFHWANSTGYLRAMMQGFIERLYPFTGDPRMIVFLQDLIDSELENGLTPKDYLWPAFPMRPPIRETVAIRVGAPMAKITSNPTLSAKMAMAICASMK